MNTFLLFIIQDRKTPLNMFQYDNALLAITKEYMKELQEKMAEKSKEAGKIFYLLFELVTILTGSIEVKKQMKLITNEFLKIVFEIFEYWIKLGNISSSAQEAFLVPLDFLNQSKEEEKSIKSETSPVHLRTSSSSNAPKVYHNKFSVVMFSYFAHPIFSFSNQISLSELLLYYLHKTLKILITREQFAYEDRTMNILIARMKKNNEILNRKIKENKEDFDLLRCMRENMRCLKIVVSIGKESQDPIMMMKKGDVLTVLMQTLQLQIINSMIYGLTSLSPHKKPVNIDAMSPQLEDSSQQNSLPAIYQYNPLSYSFKFLLLMKLIARLKQNDKKIEFHNQVEDLQNKLIESLYGFSSPFDEKFYLNSVKSQESKEFFF